ncbi:hypothetical protein E5329_16360 [Petralouisia muris]|uniref:Uncharacterized protein n=1 Tax=Petralouisia muris TaxID=3032872 RepID=A0AC61RTE4_9FIRM|nr:hypothetical protein [Petralouisia muris]TGY95136.1 hypothetical protein E5329_16360 [Petralouisia muris]
MPAAIGNDCINYMQCAFVVSTKASSDSMLIILKKMEAMRIESERSKIKSAKASEQAGGEYILKFC